MYHVSICALTVLLVTPLARLAAAEPASAPQTPADFQLITLGGEVGAAADANMVRFRSAPYDSLPWIRADLTGEKASEFDDTKGNIMRRPFKNYSGDISGRFIEIMALNSHGSRDVNPVFRELLAEVPKLQRPGGYFSEWGTMDWQSPRDSKDGKRMMPVLWGNARMLCGLVEASRAFPDDRAILSTARKLGDFYVGIVPRFTDPTRMAEYSEGGTYASGYVTCWFPAMEGLVKLSALTGDNKYLHAAITIAEFYKRFDKIPIDHSHGMLCNQVGLLLLFEATKNASYLERVEKRWDELVQGDYINPAGGIPEKCRVDGQRDEGCAEADWLRLNLELGRVTGKARYWDMAERNLHNQFLENESPTGGFGHHFLTYDQDGVYGFTKQFVESTWCCTYHGQIGFVNLRDHLLVRDAAMLTCNLALDFTSNNKDGTVVSELLPAKALSEVMRQRIRLDGLPAMVVRIRQPEWADAITAVGADGAAISVVSKNGFCATTEPVTSVEFIYAGGVYAENRHFQRLPNGPVAGQPFVLGYGPSLFAAVDGNVNVRPVWPATVAALKAQGLELFSAKMHGEDCTFVFDRSNKTVSSGAKPAEEFSEEQDLSSNQLTQLDADSTGRADNLALASKGATATADSELARESPCAAKVIDGIVATKDDFHNRWHSATDKPHPHWIEVKLPKPVVLGKVIIRFADPAGPPVNFQGFIKPAGAKGLVEVIHLTGYNDTRVCAFSFKQPVTTDTFRLVIQKSSSAKYPNAAQVSEIELYPAKHDGD